MAILMCASHGNSSRPARCAALRCRASWPRYRSGCTWGATDGVPWWQSKEAKQQQLADLQQYGPFAFERVEVIKKMGEYAAKARRRKRNKSPRNWPPTFKPSKTRWCASC